MQTATKSKLYRKAYEQKVHSLVELINREGATIQDYMSVIFLGVRSYAIARKDDKPKSLKELNAKFQAIEALKLAMSIVTPRMFINIFPITKVYDGAKYQMKDYFSVIDAIKKMGLDTPIGERLDDFLWDYLTMT